MDPKSLETEAQSAIAGAITLEELDAVRVRYLGRKSDLKRALREVRDRESGMTLNAVRERLETAVAGREDQLRRSELDRALHEEQVDITLPGEPFPRGHFHLITQARREVEDVFLGLGYQIYDGREVEDVYHNFEALNTPPGHPSRSTRDTFYLGPDVVLRTHTSPGQIRFMEAHQPPVYMISLGRCYRRDTPDATHSPVFHQVEGLAVDKGITLADLKGTLRRLAPGALRRGARRSHQDKLFPLHGALDRVRRHLLPLRRRGLHGLQVLGLDRDGRRGLGRPGRLPERRLRPRGGLGLRVRLGLERIAMLRHGLPDLRDLWQNDLRLLRQF